MSVPSHMTQIRQVPDSFINRTYKILPSDITLINFVKFLFNEPGITAELVFGDYADYIQSFLYFPFDIPYDNSDEYTDLQVGYFPTVLGGDTYTYIKTDIKVISIAKETLFMGQWFCPYGTDFFHYEPYSHITAMLPFYGQVELPIKDIARKYVQFRLSVDYKTGSAMYIIGVTDDEIENTTKVINDGRDALTRVISTHTFQLGYSLPIVKGSMTEFTRNMVMASVKSATTIAGYYIGLNAGAYTHSSKTTSTTITQGGTETYKTLNPETKRLRKSLTKSYDDTVRTSSSKRTYNTEPQARASAISKCVADSGQALATFGIKAGVDQPNNSYLMAWSNTSIVINVFSSKILSVDDTYNHLYGKPLGESKKLSKLSGYTEISKIHLEGYGFENCTLEEMSMIEDALYQGFII